MTTLQEQLISWYTLNKRDLPWRQTRSPYHIWLSEIILQQTRVDQGLAYYFRFVEQYPDVQALAAAPEHDVLKLWQGLGYYSRARNLLAAAKQVVNEFDGQFPDTYESIKKLKGVGDYTAAAIASMAFQERKAVVDGNVYRVLSRLFAIDTPINSTPGKKIFTQLANTLLPQSDPGIYNQALMEFGALYCKPGKPDCENCVVRQHCQAFAKDQVDLLPVKNKTVKVKQRFFHYLVFLFPVDGICHTLLRKRVGNDIWKGLYDFPLIETSSEENHTDILSLITENFGLETSAFTLENVSHELRHQLTHRQIIARFYQIHLSGNASIIHDNSLSLTPQAALHQFPLPRLIDKYLSENENLDCKNN